MKKHGGMSIWRSLITWQCYGCQEIQCSLWSNMSKTLFSKNDLKNVLFVIDYLIGGVKCN